MKTLLIVLNLFLFSFSTYSQTVINKSETEKIIKNGIKLIHYNDNLYSGYVVENYKNGKPKLWMSVKNGLAHGSWQEWLENGNLRYNANWKEGKGHGLWQYFHDNGTLRYEESYIMDIPIGISRAYYNNGILQHDFFWLDGKKQGDWYYYSDTGILLKTERYEKGKLIFTVEK